MAAKKKSTKKKAVTKKAAKKTVKKSAKGLSSIDKGKINRTLQRVERELLTNYKQEVTKSGKDWQKEGAKYKKMVKAEIAKARKKIEIEIRKNPVKAALVAAAIATVAGIILVRMVRGKRK